MEENASIRATLAAERSVRFVAEAWSPSAAAARPREGDQMLLHFIRHGQGFHNAAADRAREMGGSFPSGTPDAETVMTMPDGKTYCSPYKRPEMIDPPLTQSGRDQAAALQVRTRELSVDFVVVSPLCRATLTGLLAFKHAVPVPLLPLASISKASMAARIVLPGLPLSDSTTAGGARKIPFVAHEMAREHIGVHTCDQRRSIDDIKFDFPSVDYSLIESNDDVLWTAETRESTANQSRRGHALLQWIAAAVDEYGSHREVAVATHSSWLLTLFQTVLEIDTEASPGLTSWFATGEMRSVMVTVVDA